jgi:LysR family nitrogen assimilation transcriptional regulator
LSTTLILPVRQHGVRPLIEQAAAAAGLALSKLIEINSIAILKSALLADMGATLLPLAPLRAEIDSGLLAAIPVQNPPIRRSVTLCSSRTIPLTNAASAISRLVRQVTETLCANGSWPGARLPE